MSDFERRDRETYMQDGPENLFTNEVCPLCKGVGQLRKNVPYGHPDFGKSVACVCRMRALRKDRQQNMIRLSEQFGLQRVQSLTNFRRQIRGVQKAYQETVAFIHRLGTWAEQRENAKQANTVPAIPQEWLLFRGPVGTGKTHLVMAIANACIDAGLVTFFATVPQLLDHLRASYRPESDVAYDSCFLQFRDAEMLVLDDLGAQHSSPWADEKIFQLINYRYTVGWPTVFSLNTKAWTYLDERIRSRLQDAALVCAVDTDEAQDYRLRYGKTWSGVVPLAQKAL